MLGRKALVTGGSKGLGYAIAHKMASLGATITLIARNEELLQQKVAMLPAHHGQPHGYIAYNLTDMMTDSANGKSDQYKKLVQKMSQVNTLINCAGITSHSLLARSSVTNIEAMIQLNLIAPILLSQLAYRSFLKHRLDFKPKIINISSVLSMTDQVLPGTSVYAASKAGILGFTKSLAHELKGKVLVNAVMPGLIAETDMGAQVNTKSQIDSVTLEEVSQAVIDLIHNDSINGEAIIVNQDGKRIFETH